MAYWFDINIEENVYLKSFERADGKMLPDYEIAHAESYSDEEKLKLPDILRVDVTDSLKPAELPSVLGRRGAGYLFFSEALKNILTQLEPGAHDFVPVEVRVFPKPPDGSDSVLAIYYMWYSPPALEAVIPELSCYVDGFGLMARSESLGELSSSERDPCVLRGSALTARHCWREIYREEVVAANGKRYVRRRFSFFCSAELYSRVKFERLSGFDFLKKCEIK